MKLQQQKPSKRINKSNQLDLIFPDLLEEWIYEKNYIFPNEVTYGNNSFKVWWRCKKCCYEWESIILARTTGRSGCPRCNNRVANIGINDIKSFYPEIINWWSNENLKSPEEYLKNSHSKVFLECPMKKHKFTKEISSITRYKTIKCPICINRKIIKGVNDLESQFIEVMKYWDYDKNEIDPSTITYGSEKKAWWRCPKGHSFERSIKTMTRKNKPITCRHCIGSISPMEIELLNFIKNDFPELKIEQSNRKIIKPYEIDIYLPDLKIGIEFNGRMFHSDYHIQKTHRMTAYEYHEKKFKMALANNCLLFFIWSDDWLSQKEELKKYLKKALQDNVFHPIIMKFE